ncbi:hypothetical protein HKX48_002171 [Thoreauomyces humboldtii]|nr:hypothetical protein HKX48_002171 [Thoreauomyces humboldtii]
MTAQTGWENWVRILSGAAIFMYIIQQIAAPGVLLFEHALSVTACALPLIPQLHGIIPPAAFVGVALVPFLLHLALEGGHSAHKTVEDLVASIPVLVVGAQMYVRQSEVDTRASLDELDGRRYAFKGA